MEKTARKKQQRGQQADCLTFTTPSSSFHQRREKKVWWSDPNSPEIDGEKGGRIGENGQEGRAFTPPSVLNYRRPGQRRKEGALPNIM